MSTMAKNMIQTFLKTILLVMTPSYVCYSLTASARFFIKRLLMIGQRIKMSDKSIMTRKIGRSSQKLTCPALIKIAIRRLTSIIGPRTTPKTIGKIGKLNLRIMKPITPKTRTI